MNWCVRAGRQIIMINQLNNKKVFNGGISDSRVSYKFRHDLIQIYRGFKIKAIVLEYKKIAVKKLNAVTTILILWLEQKK